MNKLKSDGQYWWLYSLACLLALVFVLPPGWISAWAWLSGVRWFYLVLIAFFSANLLIPIETALAGKLGAIDYPDARKVHSFPVPRLGGAAVYGAVVFTVLRNQQFSPELLGLLAGGTLIFIVGAVEDCRGVSAAARLFWQALAALIVVSSGMHFHFTQALPAGHFLAVVFTIIWFIGITNAFNFMDGIDGLASGMGVACSIFFLGISWNTGQSHLAYLCSALAGACFGFLRVNWHPAKSFLGDSGSTFIGFMLAGFAVYGGWATDDTLVALSTPLLILGVPIFDMIYTTIARIRRGEVRTVRQWLEYVGKDHFHHRLMYLGLDVREAVGFIILVNVCLGLGAWTMHYTNSEIGALFLLMQSTLIFGIIVVLMLLGREMNEGGRGLKL